MLSGTEHEVLVNEMRAELSMKGISLGDALSITGWLFMSYCMSASRITKEPAESILRRYVDDLARKAARSGAKMVDPS